MRNNRKLNSKFWICAYPEAHKSIENSSTNSGPHSYRLPDTGAVLTMTLSLVTSSVELIISLMMKSPRWPLPWPLLANLALEVLQITVSHSSFRLGNDQWEFGNKAWNEWLIILKKGSKIQTKPSFYTCHLSHLSSDSFMRLDNWSTPRSTAAREFATSQ